MGENPNRMPIPDKHLNMEFETEFERDIYKGLTRYPKSLPSKYIYDSVGDRLFQQIMDLPEYYLTRCEWEVLDLNKGKITAYLDPDSQWDIVELGAGDGKKTRILLENFLDRGIQLTYRPIDISQNALELVRSKMKEHLPELTVVPLHGTYFDTLKDIGNLNRRKKLILFLGSNIGNLLHPQAVDFLQQLCESMNKGDILLVGFDLKKDPAVVHSAYSDREGVTERFNKNLLQRINRELGGDFDPTAFVHWQSYDPETGTCKSFLIARSAQRVRIPKLGLNISLEDWETLHTEISQKYDHDIVRWLAGKAGLSIVDRFTDSRGWYANYLFRKTEQDR